MSPTAESDSAQLRASILAALRARGMQQTELAAAAGVSKSAMTRLLKGERNISAGELAAIAHALEVPVGELLGQQPTPSRTLALAARVSASHAGDEGLPASVLDRASELLEIDDLLARRLQGPPPTLVDIPAATRSMHRDQGTEVAAAIRRSLGLGDACIEDLTEFVESNFGMGVAREPLPTEVQGLLVTDEPTGRDESGRAAPSLVLVNSADTYGRQRFTLAHELGHLVFADAQTVFVDYRGGRSLPEVRANYFAAELLMPADGVARIVADLGGIPSHTASASESNAWFETLVCKIAVSFHSSVESAIVRGNALGYLDDARKAKLFPQSALELLRRTGHDGYQDVHGTGQLDVDPPSALTAKALHGYANGLVGIGTLARLWKTSDTAALRTELSEAGWEPTFS